MENAVSGGKGKKKGAAEQREEAFVQLCRGDDEVNPSPTTIALFS